MNEDTKKLIENTLENVFLHGRISIKYKDGCYKHDSIEKAMSTIESLFPDQGTKIEVIQL